MALSVGDIWELMKANAARWPILYGHGASEEEIVAAEKRLGVAFDPLYAEFVRRWGGAMVGPDPLYGLNQPDCLGTNWSVLEVTEKFWREAWPGVSEWYIVSEDGFGNPTGVAPDGGVWISYHDGGGIQRLAVSFLDYLRGRVQSLK